VLEQFHGGTRVVADPAVEDPLDGHRGQRQATLASDAATDHQVGALEHSQMLQHGRAVQLGEARAQLTGRQLGGAQGVQHPSPDGCCERLEDEVVIAGSLNR
jgi:hypothetical protein